MEQRGENRSDHNSSINNAAISPDLLNKCLSGRRGGRLTSIFPPRLLTPGGSKKRVFLPNIPTRQEKLKENNSQEKSKDVQASRGRGYKFRERGGNNRGRGRGRGELLQLKGSVFGDGPPERTIKKEHVPRYGERGGGRGSTGNIMEMPKYTPISGTKSDDEDEEESLKTLFKDDFVYDDDDDDGALIPVNLPLTAEIKCKKEIKPDLSKIKIKKEPDDNMNIKEEMMDIDYDLKTEMDVKNIKTEKIKHENEIKKAPFAELFTNNGISESGELLFFHFPDCLPSNCIYDDDDDAGKTTQKAESNKNGDDENQNNYKWSLKEISEGLIGKLQILKSGRMRLKIGMLYFDINEGSPLGFLQQVVSLKMTGESGGLHVLGHIKSQVVCRPHLESMIKCN